MTGRVTVAAFLLSSVFGVVGCLPADTRPEPGRLYVTTDLPGDLRAVQTIEGQLSFTTEDGWSVTLTRLFVSLGGLELTGEDCNEYSEANYGRVLDMQQSGPQKLGQVWGLNGCRAGYSVYRPGGEAVLGAGVTADDRALMRNAFVPVSSETGVTTAQGMTVHVQGSAEHSSTIVSFDWGFSDRLNWMDCQRRIDGDLEATLPLVGGETIELNIEIEPRNLFQANAENAGSTSVSIMQMIADADQVNGDANGRVSIDELFSVGVPSELSGPNLAEFIRQHSYSSLFKYAGDGQCSMKPSGRNRGPGGGM